VQNVQTLLYVATTTICLVLIIYLVQKPHLTIVLKDAAVDLPTNFCAAKNVNGHSYACLDSSPQSKVRVSEPIVLREHGKDSNISRAIQ
jgi:hypothetical protein